MDKEKVRELILWAENNQYCYKHLVGEYLDNMKRRWLNGTYDSAKATKLLEYFYSNYVRPTAKKRTELGYDPKLNPQERIVFANHFKKYLEDEFLKHIKKTKK